MRILFVTPEAYPLVKTGGLGDVGGALPMALAALGHDVRILIPAYPQVLAGLPEVRLVADLGDPFGAGPARLLEGRAEGLGALVLAIDCPALYGRNGGPYLDNDGKDWPDNDLRFALLGWTAARIAHDPAVLEGWKPDALHGNDWPAGLAPAYLAAWRAESITTLFTIHNIAYQGRFPAESLARVGLPASMFQMQGLEYYGQLSFLKAGCYYSQILTTVSPTYAREIQTPEHGYGFQGLLAERGRDLHGILNGVDYDVWNPAGDSLLAKGFNPRIDKSLKAGKDAGKDALQQAFGLARDPKAPLCVVISRLTWHKGMDMVLSELPALVDAGAQFLLLGTGEPALEMGFRALAPAYPGRVNVHIGYSEPLAHRMLAGADILLMPSRSEPCGLTHLYGYRYGTVPLVTQVGGLADSVSDVGQTGAEGTGFVADRPKPDAIRHALGRAITHFRDEKAWSDLRKRIVKLDFGWERAAQEYAALYARKPHAHLRPLCW